LAKQKQHMKRTATSIWTGTGTEGQGQLTTQSKVLDEQAYSFRKRFENESGREGTNPEELIAAAQAGCFNMALAVQLEQVGYKAEKLAAKATVSLEKVGKGFSISKVHISLEASIPGISEQKFTELSSEAKANCPVSKLLNAEISLEAKLL